MTPHQVPAGPILKTITVRLSAETANQDAQTRQELVVSALAAALAALSDRSSLAWTVQAVPDGEPLLYDLTPLSGYLIASDMAWEMTDALRQQPQIASAKPSFVPALDTPPEGRR
jgi:hypothetical protein